MLFDGLAFVSCSPSPFRWTESTRLTELWAVLESRLQGQYLSTKGEQVGSFRVVLHLARCRHDPTFNQALARHHEAKAETCLRTPKCAIPAEWISQFSLISLRYRLVPRVTTSGDWLGTGFEISCLRCCCTCVLECGVCERAGPVVRPFSFPPIKSTELTEFTEFQVGRAKLRLRPNLPTSGGASLTSISGWRDALLGRCSLCFASLRSRWGSGAASPYHDAARIKAPFRKFC